jgi:hypothetical protein
MTLTLSLDTHRVRRGHDFLPSAAELAAIPALYATDGQGKDAIVHLHYFVGGADWYVTELDPETGEAFGSADLGMGPELGYIPLTELESVLAGGIFPVERDLQWAPKPLREALADR